jgi:hypothetical protein
MKPHTKTIIKSFLLFLAFSATPLTALARDSLEALRNDLNATNATLNSLQTQVSGLANVRYVMIEFEGDVQSVGAKVLGPGIECSFVDGSASGDCSEVYPIDYKITLKSIVGPNTLFSGWRNGSCSGTGDCTLTVSDDLHLVAEFKTKPTPDSDPNTFSVEYARIDFPCYVNNSIGQGMPNVYGRLYAPGLTDITLNAPDLYSGLLVAQLGTGPHGSQPDSSAEWIWLPAEAIQGDGIEDIYVSVLPTLGAGVYDYAFRFGKIGETLVYADCNGSQDGYNPEQAGILEVMP